MTPTREPRSDRTAFPSVSVSMMQVRVVWMTVPERCVTWGCECGSAAETPGS